MDQQDNQFIYKDSNLARTQGLVLLFVSGLYILVLKINLFSFGARGNALLERIAWFFLGISILIVLFSGDLIVIANKSLRMLRLQYRSILFRRNKDIPFENIFDIQLHSDHGNIELPTNAHYSIGNSGYRLVVVLKDGTNIPFRHSFTPYGNKKVIVADLRFIVTGSRQSAIIKVKSAEYTLPIKMTIYWWTKAIFIAGIFFFPFLAVISYSSEHNLFYVLFFTLFALFEIYGLISSLSFIAVDQSSIKVSSPPQGIYSINWQDVQYVETNGITFAFFGDNKHLVFSLVFFGKGKREFLSFFNKFVQERQLDVKPISSMRMTQKNTKIS